MKGNMSFEQCISTIKDLINYLLVVEYSISEKEQMLYVLGRLDAQYASLVTNSIEKKWILGMDELFTLLRVHDR